MEVAGRESDLLIRIKNFKYGLEILGISNKALFLYIVAVFFPDNSMNLAAIGYNIMWNIKAGVAPLIQISEEMLDILGIVFIGFKPDALYHAGRDILRISYSRKKLEIQILISQELLGDFTPGSANSDNA